MIRRINLFGGPGAGKSTLAALLYGALKHGNRSVELVQEWIKPWAYEKRPVRGFEQYYIFGQQMHLEEQYLLNGVDLVVSDSPLWLNQYYGKRYEVPMASYLCPIIRAFDREYPPLNIFLGRAYPYQQEGRYETEEQAREVDNHMAEYLDHLGIPYVAIPADRHQDLLQVVSDAIFTKEAAPV